MPTCINAAANTIRAVAIIQSMSEDNEKEKTLQPLPSTLNNFATEIPSNDDKKSKNIGKQAKRMNDKQIGKLARNVRWHKTSLKIRIASSCVKELRDPQNFDFYKDPKSDGIYIKSNYSKEMIKVNMEKFYNVFTANFQC